MSIPDFDPSQLATSTVETIRGALALIHTPGEVFEVRIPRKFKTLVGYFKDPSIAALEIKKNCSAGAGIYATVNPIRADLFARSSNVLALNVPGTADFEVLSRRWFLLDFDPVRSSGVSSTDEELRRAKELAQTVQTWLDSLGWIEPISACSGNGWHLMYRIDMPNDEKSQVDIDAATKMLAFMFSTAEVSIDTSVSNAARVWKIYGTRSKKGTHTQDRPHRDAYIHTTPVTLRSFLNSACIEKLAETYRQANAVEYQLPSGEYIADMSAWLAQRGQHVISGPRSFGEGQKWILATCPFNTQHVHPMVGLVHNRPLYRCLHNSCSEHKWFDFRSHIDPEYKTPTQIKSRIAQWGLSDSATPDLELVQLAAQLGAKLPPMMRALKKELPASKWQTLQDQISEHRKQYLKELKGDNNERGNLVGVMQRVRKYIEKDAAPEYWTCAYDHRIRVGPAGDIACPKLSESDEIALMVLFHADGDSWVKQQLVSQAIKFIASENVVNPLKKHMLSKKWDSVPRLDTWLIDYMGTKDTAYTRAVGRKWLISAVARAMDPGCQADHMLIFEGRQGVGKSRAARILGGNFYAEFGNGFKGQNAQRDLAAIASGKIIVELSEMAALKRTEIESLKALLTTCADDVRMSYERDVQTYPRTCVFIGTTNELGGGYIPDKTGARRFWPVHVSDTSAVHTSKLAKDCNALWGEAVAAYLAGEDWHSIPTEETLQEQAHRQVHTEDTDPWHALILRSLTDPDSFVDTYTLVPFYQRGLPTEGWVLRTSPVHLILSGVLHIDSGRQTAHDALRVRQILQELGFVKVRPGKPMHGATWVYDLRPPTLEHLWPAIVAAHNLVPFKKKLEVSNE